jgi:hypothetical protein
MYVLNPNIKNDPEKRWALPDRVFFGNGACHILAGVYLDEPPMSGFHAEKITPIDGFSGNHIFLTDGKIAFDYHGYSVRSRLLEHHRRGWSRRYLGWGCKVAPVDYDLLSTVELNCRKMRGPDQYLHDPVDRARKYIGRISHHAGYAKAMRGVSAGVRQRSADGGT